MDVLKLALDWTKAEIFSSWFFVLFGAMFLIASLGFWQIGKTELAKAFVIPTLVAAILLMIVGIGLVVSNNSRLASFETAYLSNPVEFVQSEITRVDKTKNEYATIAFKIIPCLIILAALLIFLVDKANWRAISMTTIAMLIVVVMIDSNANARLDIYKQQLQSFLSK